MLKSTLRIAFSLLFVAVCTHTTLVGQDLSESTGTRFQTEELPPKLFVPSERAINHARTIGAEVFKVVPIGTSHPAMKWFGDGIWLNDGTFSTRIDLGNGKSEFIRRLYSRPNIYLSILRGQFSVDGPWGYGFFADLGDLDLQNVDRTLSEAEFFLSYTATKPVANFVEEDRRLSKLVFESPQVKRKISVKAGHTYLLRAICYNRSDIAGVFKIFEIEPDGSATIIWKKLAEFEVTRRPGT